MPFDLLIKNAHLVTCDGVEPLDIAIENGTIVDLAESITRAAKQTIDATGLHIFPGTIDAHVHFNDAGATSPQDRADWEGIPTGSAALAAGGGTTFFDMPLNSIPPTLDAASFDAKLNRARAASHTDFALWGGLTPKNLEHLEALADRGVIGFKAFMTNTGVPEFLAADDDTLLRGMTIAAKLKLPVALHAEDESLTFRLTAQARAGGKTSIRDYLDSRPIEAEVRAIRRAIQMSRETGCSIHIVHISSAAGLAEVNKANSEIQTSEFRIQHFHVTAETCPHYLLLNENDVETLGAAAKCSPPIRSESERQKLLAQLLASHIDTIGSDHSPAPANLKTSPDFFAIWGGISGVQLTLRALLTLDIPLPLIAAFLAENPATRFNLPNKNGITEGADADLTLVDLSTHNPLTQNELLDRHRLCPYLGRPFRGTIRQTLLRGATIFRDGQIISSPGGHFLRPNREA